MIISRRVALPIGAGCALAVALYVAIPRRHVEDAPLPYTIAGHERLTAGPSLESVSDSNAMIRWEADSIAGTRTRIGIVHYGTDPKTLDGTARSPTRWNSTQPSTVFRVYLHDLRPSTTYYYTIESSQATGRSDQVEAPMGHFTTAAAATP
jgi:hypothetical protein